MDYVKLVIYSIFLNTLHV